MKFPDSSKYVDWYAFFRIFGRMCDIYILTFNSGFLYILNIIASCSVKINKLI